MTDPWGAERFRCLIFSNVDLGDRISQAVMGGYRSHGPRGPLQGGAAGGDRGVHPRHDHGRLLRRFPDPGLPDSHKCLSDFN